jgi:hypothetical protein
MITSIAYQRNPDPMIWATLSDGTLISCNYDPLQNVIAWAQHPMGTAAVESVAVIPASDEDEVWLSVQRTVDSSTVRYIERMKPHDWGSDAEDMFFIDSGLTYDSTATTTITGLDHLEGETVSILGDRLLRFRAAPLLCRSRCLLHKWACLILTNSNL